LLTGLLNLAALVHFAIIYLNRTTPMIPECRIDGGDTMSAGGAFSGAPSQSRVLSSVPFWVGCLSGSGSGRIQPRLRFAPNIRSAMENNARLLQNYHGICE